MLLEIERPLAECQVAGVPCLIQELLKDAPPTLTRDERQETWAAIDLVHEALGEVVPPGTLPSQEAVNGRYGPSFMSYAQVFVEAIHALAKSRSG